MGLLPPPGLGLELMCSCRVSACQLVAPPSSWRSHAALTRLLRRCPSLVLLFNCRLS